MQVSSILLRLAGCTTLFLLTTTTTSCNGKPVTNKPVKTSDPTAAVYNGLSASQKAHYPHRASNDAASGKKVVPIIVKPGAKGEEHQVAVVGSSKNPAKGTNLPRGKVKEKESFRQAGLREGFEETGYHATDLRPVGGRIKGKDNGKPVQAQVYHLKEGAQQLSHEDRIVKFVPVSQAGAHVSNPGTQKLLRKAGNNINKVPQAGTAATAAAA